MLIANVDNISIDSLASQSSGSQQVSLTASLPFVRQKANLEGPVLELDIKPSISSISGRYAFTQSGFCQPVSVRKDYELIDNEAIENYLASNLELIDILNNFYQFAFNSFEVTKISLEYIEDYETQLSGLIITPYYNVSEIDEAMELNDKAYLSFIAPLSPSVRKKLTLSFG